MGGFIYRIIGSVFGHLYAVSNGYRPYFIYYALYGCGSSLKFISMNKMQAFFSFYRSLSAMSIFGEGYALMINGHEAELSRPFQNM